MATQEHTMTEDDTTVWFLVGTLAVGGTERTLVDLVGGLDRERFAPVIWTIAEPGPLADEVPDDVPVRSLGARNKLDVRAVARFVAAVRRERPDVLQSFLFFDNVLARLAGIASPRTTVITGVREIPTSPPRHRRLVDRVTQPLSDLVVSNSEAGAAYATEHGVPERTVRVVHNGRDIERFATAESPPDFRHSIGVPADAPLVGTVGRLVERKGHYDLLDAWEGVLAEHPRAHLVIVGDGPEREGLARRAAENGIADSVHLLGRREDVPALLSAFDVFAFPSHYEGMPGALLEAMAAGLPIVTTPVDGSAELVRDGEHGVYVPVEDPAALSEGIVGLLSDPERAGALGARAQERAREGFAVEAMVSSFEALYDECS